VSAVSEQRDFKSLAKGRFGLQKVRAGSRCIDHLECFERKHQRTEFIQEARKFSRRKQPLSHEWKADDGCGRLRSVRDGDREIRQEGTQLSMISTYETGGDRANTEKEVELFLNGLKKVSLLFSKT
jgi:hypothetical protein